MTANIVQFDYSKWEVRYPELAKSVSENLATIYFEEAQLYCDNSPASPVGNLTIRAALLGMVTAHIAKLNAVINGEEASPLVGRITDATEGSVSVKVAVDARPGSEQWFVQTRYGFAFWQASAGYRTGFYVPGPVDIVDPYEPFLFNQ